jgi:preprotein translocase SecE subunit
VARDRQRAKQRRRRSGGSRGPASGTARPRPRDATPAAPEPTDQAHPYVDEAELAEAGAEEFQRAPDEVAADDAGFAPDPAIAEERAEAARPGRKRAGFIAFLGHVVDELRRVQWPDRRHVAQGTAVVLGFVVIAGAYLGLMDAIWRPVVEAII